MDEKSGKAIFLNGTSSSGKSTIAKELQKVLAEPYLHISIDTFLDQFPSTFPDSSRFNREMPRLLDGFNESNASLVRTGNNVIIDHVLQERSELDSCITSMNGFDVVFVAVRCSLEVLEEREKARGDRRLGLARIQYNQVHAHDTYDIEVDTSLMSIGACVATICTFVRSGRRPSAFGKLAAVNKNREPGAVGNEGHHGAD